MIIRGLFSRVSTPADGSPSASECSSQLNSRLPRPAWCVGIAARLHSPREKVEQLNSGRDGIACTRSLSLRRAWEPAPAAPFRSARGRRARSPSLPTFRISYVAPASRSLNFNRWQPCSLSARRSGFSDVSSKDRFRYARDRPKNRMEFSVPTFAPRNPTDNWHSSAPILAGNRPAQSAGEGRYLDMVSDPAKVMGDEGNRANESLGFAGLSRRGATLGYRTEAR